MGRNRKSMAAKARHAAAKSSGVAGRGLQFMPLLVSGLDHWRETALCPGANAHWRPLQSCAKAAAAIFELDGDAMPLASLLAHSIMSCPLDPSICDWVTRSVGNDIQREQRTALGEERSPPADVTKLIVQTWAKLYDSEDSSSPTAHVSPEGLGEPSHTHTLTHSHTHTPTHPYSNLALCMQCMFPARLASAALEKSDTVSSSLLPALIAHPHPPPCRCRAYNALVTQPVWYRQCSRRPGRQARTSSICGALPVKK